MRFLKRLSPRRTDLTQRWFLRPFGALIHDPALWRLDRHGAARAVAIGVFISWLPLPMHMAIAAALALLLRLHLPLSVIAVWLSNPVTTLPMLYFAYRLGLLLLGLDPGAAEFEFSAGWLWMEFARVWQPLLLGSVVAGALSAVLAYFALDGLWHWTLVRKYRRIQAAAARRAARESRVDQ